MLIPLGNDRPTTRMPVVTWALLVINTLAFMRYGFPGLTYLIMPHPWGFTPANFSVVALFTSMFMHVNFLHLLGNMIYLWVFGNNVEEVFGHTGFLALYLGTGIAAGLTHYVFNLSSTIPAMGASGAISGVLGAYLILFASSRVKVLMWIWWYIRVFWIHAGWFLGFYFALQMSLALVPKGGGGGVAYWAHIGGFAAGLAATLILQMRGVIERPKQPGAPGKGALSEALKEAIRERDMGLTAGGGSVGEASQYAAKEPAARISEILERISSGKFDEAIMLARREERMRLKHPSDAWQLARVADAFYQKGIHRTALQVYEESLSRAHEQDERVAELSFRAGMIASRHVRDMIAAERLLSDAANRHADARWRVAADNELGRIRENLKRTSITDGGGFVEGPCAIIRQTADPVDIAKIGTLVATTTGRVLAEVTLLLRRSVGFVATNVDPVTAGKLAMQLQEMGMPVLVVPESKLVALPEACEVVSAAVWPDHIALFNNDGEEILKKWDHTFYASAGFVQVSQRKRVPDEFGSSMPRYMGMGSFTRGGFVQVDDGMRWKYKDTQVTKIVLDMFTLRPFQCWRIFEDKVTLSGSQQALTYSRSLNFRRLLTDLTLHGRTVPTNEGVHLIASQAPARRCRGVTFNGIEDFERYNYWRLQLEQYG